jgi:hypothetical protein
MFQRLNCLYVLCTKYLVTNKVLEGFITVFTKHFAKMLWTINVKNCCHFMKFYEISAPNIMFDIGATVEFIIWGNWCSPRWQDRVYKFIRIIIILYCHLHSNKRSKWIVIYLEKRKKKPIDHISCEELQLKWFKMWI